MTSFATPADLALALDLADTADVISLARFGAADLHVDSKPDLTPVSDADLAVETRLREVLAEQRPDDVVVGEEFGDSSAHQADTSSWEANSGAEQDTATSPIERAGRGRCWVIDPIDGTKNFVRGVPIWATLIALLVDGVPVVGVVSAPALARRWWGGTDQGAWASFAEGPARQCRVSAVSTIDDASLSIAQLNSWEEAGRGEQIHELSRRCWRTRGYGDFYSYMLVAEGAVDIACEPELSLWDVAALAPIVMAAGGTLTTIDGTDIGPSATSALASNARLHQEALSALASRS